MTDENAEPTQAELDAFDAKLEDTFAKMLEAIQAEKERMEKTSPADEVTLLLAVQLSAVLVAASGLSASLPPDLLDAAEEKAARVVRACAESLGQSSVNVPVRKAAKIVHLHSKEELRSFLESALGGGVPVPKDPSKLN